MKINPKRIIDKIIGSETENKSINTAIDEIVVDQIIAKEHIKTPKHEHKFKPAGLHYTIDSSMYGKIAKDVLTCSCGETKEIDSTIDHQKFFDNKPKHGKKTKKNKK